MIVSLSGLSGLSKGCSTHRLTSRKGSGNANRFNCKMTVSVSDMSKGVLQTDRQLGNVLVMLTVLTARWQYLCQVCLRCVLHTGWQVENVLVLPAILPEKWQSGLSKRCATDTLTTSKCSGNAYRFICKMIVSLSGLSGLSKGCSTHRLTSRKCSGNAYCFAWKMTGLSNGVLQTDWRLGNVLVMLTVLTARWQYLCQVCLRVCYTQTDN